MPEDNKHYVTLFMVCTRENDDDQAEVLEPDKCDGWEWVSWKELKEWIKVAADARERKPFIPLINLVGQRPDVVPSLD